MKKTNWTQLALRVVALVFVIAVSAYIFSIRDKAQEFAKYSYPGIFLLSFMAYATVFLPAPGIAVVFTMGAVFNPFIVALVAGAGAALGELTGYLVGFSSQPVVERVNMDTYQRMVTWLTKFGSIAVLVLSAVPNPFFDLTGLAAGALKMPVFKFLLWTWLGETIKMMAISYAGSTSLNLLSG